LAHGGTLFLDEIGELPLAMQSKLLRVLEGGIVQRLGSNAESRVDVRLIAATNRDLERAVAAGAFRQDLYYRLAVFVMRIPALAERDDDVLLLASHFLDRFRRELKKPGLALSEEAKIAIRNYSWPGNVRELQNAIERAAILGEGILQSGDLGLPVMAKAAAAGAETPTERSQFERALRESKWNRRAAAERLGIPYRTLLARLREYGLS
jgi:transcriptional regulator with GAF, ATPase, and Fis domain